MYPRKSAQRCRQAFLRPVDYVHSLDVSDKAHLSVTISKTCPSMVVWPNIRAKRPSSSSHMKLQSTLA